MGPLFITWMWERFVLTQRLAARSSRIRLASKSLQAHGLVMSTSVKICGLSTPEAVNAALIGGAGLVGFVFFDKSPRKVTPEVAARLAAPVRSQAKVVAVTVDPDDGALDEIMATLNPDLIQLHGKESPARTAAIKARTGAGVIKAVSVAEPDELDAAARYEGAADHLMFDAKTPAGSPLPGGMGTRFDWDMLRGRRFARAWFLAGGLDPWNVIDAIRRSGAPLVDVSSGVERGPGLKDPALISAFLDAVRKA
jgi:phosphoribosylanthranilate isomerase